MTTILTTQENNLIESITRNYGQVSFEYDAVMELVEEKASAEHDLKIAIDVINNGGEKITVSADAGPNVIKPNGPITGKPDISGHSSHRLI